MEQAKTKRTFTLLTLALGLFAVSPAFAGSNVCEGKVAVGTEWTTIIGDTGDFAPNGCRFRSNSPAFKKIIAKCPNGSECAVDFSLNSHAPVNGKGAVDASNFRVDHVEQAK